MKCDQLLLGFVHFVDLDVELLSDVGRCALLLDDLVSPGVKHETAILFTGCGSLTMMMICVNASVCRLPMIIGVEIHGFNCRLTTLLFVKLLEPDFALSLLNSDLNTTGIAC